MRLLYTFIGIVWMCSLMGQQVDVSGVAMGRSGAMVRVITYADQFSMLEKTIAKTYCDGKGAFKLRLEVDQPEFAFLALNLHKGEFYLSPDASYQVDIPYQKPVSGSLFDQMPLQFNLNVDGDNNLQAELERFNQLYNNFVYDNAQALYRSRSKQVVQDFKSEMEKSFSNLENDYLQQYIHYTFVSLDWLSKRMSDQSVLATEIVGKPILFNNIQYTDFFKTFFDNYLEIKANKYYSDMVYAINQQGSCGLLEEFFLRDSLLSADTQVSELAMMLLLSRFYYAPEINKKAVIEKLELLAKRSEFTKNSTIATNFITRLTHLDYGFPAPEFSLMNSEGKLVSLHDYLGRFVLLDYVTDGCQVCLDHFEKIKEIKDSFADSLAVLTLVVQNTDTIQPVGRHPVEGVGELLQVPSQSTLPELYQIRAYPTYVLINPDGTLAHSTLPMPEENLEFMIERFFKRFGH